MVQKEITEEMIKNINEDLEFYDKNKFFPFQKKRIDFTISRESLIKLEKVENKSQFVDNLILNN